MNTQPLARRLRWFSCLGIALSMLFAATASAQEVLPFPPTPSASTAGLTMQDSTYKKRVEPKRLADGAPNILIILMDDVGPATAVDLRRRDQHADARSRGEDGYFLQPFSYDGDVLAHAGRAVDRAQPHARRQRPDRRAGQRLRRFQRQDPEVLGDRRRGAQELRLQHRRLGQVAQHARGGRHQQGSFRLLADRPWLRVFLRLPRRRGLAIRAAVGAQHHAGEPARATPQGLPPHRGHRRGRHQVAARTAGLRAGQAVLHVLGAGRIAWPAPYHEGMGRQIQGQVRRRLGQVSRARFCQRQGEGLDPAEHPAHAAPRFHGVLGFDSRG